MEKTGCIFGKRIIGKHWRGNADERPPAPTVVATLPDAPGGEGPVLPATKETRLVFRAPPVQTPTPRPCPKGFGKFPVRTKL